MSELANLAEDIARDAHAGQVDKIGEPYIEHVGRVAARVTTDDERAVAWLHDVLEDTGITADDLRHHDIPDHIVTAVEAITHHKHEPRADYYTRVRANPLALAVKLADVADNSDPARLAGLDEATRVRLVAKYAKARAHLNGDTS